MSFDTFSIAACYISAIFSSGNSYFHKGLWSLYKQGMSSVQQPLLLVSLIGKLLFMLMLLQSYRMILYAFTQK